MEVEADKHPPQLLEDLGLSKRNAIKTPRVKLSKAESIESNPLLEGAIATAYHNKTIRAAYLGQDRVDIAQTIAHPRKAPLAQLKRLARSHLKGVLRFTLRCRAQSPEDALLAARVDSDWASDPITRRSTTTMILRREQWFSNSSNDWTQLNGARILCSYQGSLHNVRVVKSLGRLESHIGVSIPHRLLECQSGGDKKRNWKEHSPRPDRITLVARESGRETPQSAEGSHRGEPSNMLTKALPKARMKPFAKHWVKLGLEQTA